MSTMQKHLIYKTSLTNALVRILKGDSRIPVGAGFLVTPMHILTCAHVVCDALDLPVFTKDVPDRQVWFDFPIIEQQPTYSANVVKSKWHPYHDAPVVGELEDMALLELTPETVLTDKARPASVVILEEFFDREVRMCGFPSGMDHGSWGTGRLRDLIACGWVQLDSELDSHSIRPGFSGTAVWDHTERAVVGMITRRLKQDGLTSGYMIPGKTIIKAFPELDQLSRPRNPYKAERKEYNMTICFCAMSAIIKLYHTEAGTEWMDSVFKDKQLTIVISELTTVEFCSADQMKFVCADSNLIRICKIEGIDAVNPETEFVA